MVRTLNSSTRVRKTNHLTMVGLTASGLFRACGLVVQVLVALSVGGGSSPQKVFFSYETAKLFVSLLDVATFSEHLKVYC